MNGVAVTLLDKKTVTLLSGTLDEVDRDEWGAQWWPCWILTRLRCYWVVEIRWIIKVGDTAGPERGGCRVTMLDVNTVTLLGSGNTLYEVVLRGTAGPERGGCTVALTRGTAGPERGGWGHSGPAG